MISYFRRTLRRFKRSIKLLWIKIMALPKWLRKLIAILEIIFERNANQGKAIAVVLARVEALEKSVGANAEGDAALAKRIEELQAESEAEDAEAEALFAGFKTDEEESEETAPAK
jgi:hypothetical protein